MTEMVFGTTPVRAGDPILPRWWRTLDKWSLTCVLGLFAIGLLLGLAASVPLAEKNNLPRFYYVQRQMVFGGMGLFVMLVISMLTPRQIRRIGVLGFAVSFLLILALPIIGTDFGKGATRWLSLGFVSVQPSEFLKPGFVALCAWFMASAQEPGGPPGRIYSFGAAMTIVILLALQPDFGQASLVLFSWLVMYFVAGSPVILIVCVAGLAGMGGLFAYNASEHFARRINSFLSSEIDANTQIYFATNAIQEGRFFGVGVGEGTVKWSLPDAHTDFIIAVAAEEFGLVLCVLILALYATIVVRSLLRLIGEPDPFIRLAGTGLAVLLGMQAMINIGVAVRLLPAKGMTLPLISYGGSSLIAAGLGLGALLALTRRRPRHEIHDMLGGSR